MRTIVHLSDLHFGRIHYPLIQPLISMIQSVQPHLIAISGDFTQRARTSQFKEAREFLNGLPFPMLVVPGNHDVPLYNVFARFCSPLVKYRRYITPDLSPFYHDDELAVGGINTARALTSQFGRISEKQVVAMVERFRPFGPEVTKIVVTHHPMDLPPDYADHHQLVGRAEMAMKAFSLAGVDLLLSGHLHLTHTGLIGNRYKIVGCPALVVQAGTATSTRGRGEANSFNILRIDSGRIDVERILWEPEPGVFQLATKRSFERQDGRWEERVEP